MKEKDGDLLFKYWIGANDKRIEGKWEWSDGSQFDYDNWDYKEPNSHLGAEDCAVIEKKSDRPWHDSKCFYWFRYICKK